LQADVVLVAYDFMTDFNGPSRHFPQPFYPAGVYDADKTQYKFGPPSSTYPTLTLPCSLYDDMGDTISEGFYTVALSLDLKYLELYQSNTLKARVKVIKLVEKMFTNEELDEEAEIIDRLQKAQNAKKLKKYRKAEEDLTAFRERAAARNYAKIEDSGKGYYILEYYYNGKKATGIIQK
jgi:hypothetical protein